MPTRPCWVEISTRALEENYKFLRGLAGPDAECLAIVKANAYGHGLALCAPAVVRAGARWLGVTSVEEGIEARGVCPEARILVIGGIFPGQGEAVFRYALTPVVWEPWHIEELESQGRALERQWPLPVHLEIDTGMSRQGAGPDHLSALLTRLAEASTLSLEAIMTHLYASDESGGETTAAQLDRLDQTIPAVWSSQPPYAGRFWLSVGASAALLGKDFERIAALSARLDAIPMLRIGLALYGVVPRYAPAFVTGQEPGALIQAQTRLQPVHTWKTRVVSVRSIPAGTEVGYNGTFIATEPMRIALLAAGYADGLDRRLGNRFSLLVRGQRAPLIGRISMDQSVIDVTEIPGVEPGDEVVILGSQGDERITAFDHADACGTIPWEVLTRIAARVPRMEALESGTV